MEVDLSRVTDSWQQTGCIQRKRINVVEDQRGVLVPTGSVKQNTAEAAEGTFC